MEQSLRSQARREVLQQIASQYRQASPEQKRTLLEAFMAATGYVPKYASGSSTMPKRRNGHKDAHGFASMGRKSNTRCFWPDMPPTALHEREPRRIGGSRSQRTVGQRGLSTTRAETLLKQQIPIRTFQQWNETPTRFSASGCASGL